ncbi:MAG: endonuclease [Acidobacteria bacterium]|nr:endonuclease [Acidobacteriota bacterium]
MANSSKAQVLADIQTLLKKRYKTEPTGTKFNVLEAVVYAICHENATKSQADRAFARFKSDFFDWNEVRVSSIDEIRAVFKGMQDEEERAAKLRRFLRQLFDKTYGFNLDALAKKPLKDSIKTLQEYEAFQSDYLVAEVSRLGLGGHAIGLDRAALRLLERLGLGSGDGDVAALRGSVERAVSKTRGPEFAVLVAEVCADVCVEPEPKCPACDLKKLCPTGSAKISGKTTPAAAKSPPAAEPSAAKKGSEAEKTQTGKPEAKKVEAKPAAAPAPPAEKGKTLKPKAVEPAKAPKSQPDLRTKPAPAKAQPAPVKPAETGKKPKTK